jgi:hypothetical protein
MVKNELMKRVFIAGASSALKYKEKNPNATESEIMSNVTKEMKKLIAEIAEDY